jgi:hypothetical protein
MRVDFVVPLDLASATRTRTFDWAAPENISAQSTLVPTFHVIGLDGECLSANP